MSQSKGTSNTYDFQEEGEVIFEQLDTGDTYSVLGNLTEFSVSYSGDPETKKLISTGDKTAKSFTGVMPDVEVTLSFSMFDEEGIDGSLNQFRKNTPTGERMEIVVRPLGTGSGKKEMVFSPSDNKGFYLSSGGYEPTISESYEAAIGKMEWKGTTKEGPEWTTQA